MQNKQDENKSGILLRSKAWETIPWGWNFAPLMKPFGYDMLPCWKQLVNQSIIERKIAIFVRGINTVLIVCADTCWWKLLTLSNYLKTCLQNSNWRRKFSYCIPTFLDIVEWIFLLFHWDQKTIAAFSHETKKMVDIAS